MKPKPTAVYETEFAEDLKEIIKKNPIVYFKNKKLKQKILNAKDDDLFLTRREIGYNPFMKKSGILITKVEKVDDEYIKKNF